MVFAGTTEGGKTGGDGALDVEVHDVPPDTAADFALDFTEVEEGAIAVETHLLCCWGSEVPERVLAKGSHTDTHRHPDERTCRQWLLFSDQASLNNKESNQRANRRRPWEFRRCECFCRRSIQVSRDGLLRLAIEMVLYHSRGNRHGTRIPACLDQHSHPEQQLGYTIECLETAQGGTQKLTARQITEAERLDCL